MKLHVIGTVAAAYAFGLRHFPAFYLLCFLAGLPSYAYSLLPCPEWQGRFATDGAETLVACLIIAIMAAALKRDTREEVRTVLPAIGDTIERSTTVLGVSIVSTVVFLSFSALSHYLFKLHPQAPIALQIAYFVLVAFFCMAIPSAARDNGGVVDSFKRSAALSAGSRLRIVATYLLALIPLGAAWGVLLFYGPDLEVESLWAMWTFLVVPAFNVFLLALPAVIHASLAGPEDDISFVTPEAVFD